MRTTIDLSEGLAIQAKKAAAERKTSLKQLVEDGLRIVLARGHAGAAYPRSPLKQLKGLGKRVWEGVDPDLYVREQRGRWP